MRRLALTVRNELKRVFQKSTPPKRSRTRLPVALRVMFLANSNSRRALASWSSRTPLKLPLRE